MTGVDLNQLATQASSSFPGEGRPSSGTAVSAHRSDKQPTSSTAFIVVL